MPGATVALSSGQTTTTDDFGHFAFSGLTPGLVIVQVTTPTAPQRYFASYTTSVSYGTALQTIPVVSGETTHVFPRVVEGCLQYVNTGTGSSSGSTVVTLPVTGGVCSDAPRPAELSSVTFDASQLVDVTSGQPVAFAGTIQVEMIPTATASGSASATDLPVGSWFLGTPGDGLGDRLDGSTVALQDLGGVEIRFFDVSSGDPLQLAPTNPAVLVVDTTRINHAGEAVGAFALDTTSGDWVELDAGLAFSELIDGGSPTVAFTVPQLGVPLLVGSPLGGTSCVQGTVTVAGAVVPGLELAAFGVDHGAGYFTRADDNGNFCFDVKAASAIAVDAVGQSAGAGYRALGTATSGASGTSCAVGTGCFSMGTLDLSPEDTVCATGQFFGPEYEFPSDGGDSTPTPNPSSEPFYVDVAVSPEEQQVGRYPRIYRGDLVPNADATFCVAALPWPAYEYIVGTEAPCLGVIPINLAIDGGDSGGQCSTDPGQCQALGDLDFYSCS